MTYLHFIVNPISGKGKHLITKELLDLHFPKSEYTIGIDYSNYKKHAILLTKQAINKNPDSIIACGGDGTINEVASCLINTQIVLGIIPVGSGNGLASNLQIPKDISKAIAVLKKNKRGVIDVGKINNKYFFSNMGLGIDSLVIHKYELNKKRTLAAYISAFLQASAEYKPAKRVLEFNNLKVETEPFLLFISNSNIMGYRMSLTPSASLSDGLLDLLIVPKCNFFDKLKLGILVVLNKPDLFKKAQRYLIENLKIKASEKTTIELQIDGEYFKLDTNEINVSILPNCLNVVFT